MIQEKIMFRNSYNYLECESKNSEQLSVSSEQFLDDKERKFNWRILINLLITIYCSLLTVHCIGQKPQGKFIADSVEIGKPIDFVLSYRHLPTAEIFFPDTTYNFHPFELVRRNYFPTQTDSRGSVDSVVYTLVTFDIDKVQKLSLPVYVFNEQDCTAVYSSIDSVYLREMIKGSLDSLSLKTDTKFLHIEPQVNYPKLLGYILGIVAFVGLIYLFFGKFIRKQYQLFLFSRRHNEFVSNYKKLVKGSLDDKNISKAVVLWKKHLEWLEKRPYTSYTTKEIIARLPNESLEEALKDVDTAIYGGILSTQMPFAMNVLLNTAVELYKKRREEISSQ